MEPAPPQMSFGTVDEILHPTSQIYITEHPFHLNLLSFGTVDEIPPPTAGIVITPGSPPATSVVSEEEIVDEILLSTSGITPGSLPATSVVSEEVMMMANMTKDGRDWIRHEKWIQKVNIIQ